MYESAVKRNRIAKVIIAMFLLVAICFSVACKGETEEDRTINGNAKLEDYFWTEKFPYKNPSPELIKEFEEKTHSVEVIQRFEHLITEPNFHSDDFCSLYPKQKVKITKITLYYYWNPKNQTETALKDQPDEWVTTIFTENFRVQKDKSFGKKYVEITPESCYWLKETMTPDDYLSFRDETADKKNSYRVQFCDLKIYFSVIK